MVTSIVIVSIVMIVIGIIGLIIGIIMYENNIRKNLTVNISSYILLIGGTVVTIIGAILLGYEYSKNRNR